MDKIKIGNYLKDLRKKKRRVDGKPFTQADLSDALASAGLEVSINGINEWESGKSLPSPEKLDFLSKIYNKTIDEILEGEDINQVDYKKVYFIYNNDWFNTVVDEDKIFPMNQEQILKVYNRFRELSKIIIKYGGLPYINSLDKEYEKHEYLKMINDTVATKDIIDRNKIRNEEVFNAVIDLLCSQIGCYVSPNKIANTLVSNGFKTVDNDTVSNYLKYLCDAFIFYKAVRYDLKGKEYLKTLNKYYICDLGLRNQRLGYRQMEMTHIIENIVYLELLRRNYQVDIGKNKESEIDFVVRSHDDLYYIQVSLSIENESTRMREENAFKGLDDGYKKIIITMDNNPLIHLERGYKMLNLFDFLLNENILKSI